MLEKFLGAIKQKVSNYFLGALPKSYSMSEENNILGLYDEHFLLTKNENLVGILRLEGVSYTHLSTEQLQDLFTERQMALDSLEKVVARLVVKRRKIDYKQSIQSDSQYLQAILNQFENKEVYENQYFLVLESAHSLQGVLEHKKKSFMHANRENFKDILSYKAHFLQETFKSLEIQLKNYAPKLLNSKEVLNFYAEYINGFDLPLKPLVGGYLSDSYIASSITFEKDYFIQESFNQKTYNRLIGIKAYESERITSIAVGALLYQETPLDIIFSIEPMSTHKTLSFLKERAKFSMSNLVKNELLEYQELVKTKRLSMQKFALNVLIKAPSLEDLDAQTSLILGLLFKENLVGVIETFGLKGGYFSFFPERIYLNHRLRFLTSKALACLMVFERQNLGFKANSWGNSPLSVFKNLDYSPFLFNFHNQEVSHNNAKEIARVNGHTLVIGATGSGKSTLISYLMMSALKYQNMRLLAFDRMQGLYSFTEFFKGHYHDGQSFSINPFCLEPNLQNLEFLQSFFLSMLDLAPSRDKEALEDMNAISGAIKSLYETLYPKDFSLLDFKETLKRTSSNQLGLSLEPYLNNPLFNALNDAFNSNAFLNVINLDAITQNPKDLGLLAYYLFYKILEESRKNDSGFLVFLDEFKSYVENDLLNTKINALITQARKANGVVVLALQDIYQLSGVKNAHSFLSNMGTLILYPQKNARELKHNFNVPLSETEISFLENTPLYARQVLVKNLGNGSSNMIDVSLEGLGRYLKIFNSDSSHVNKVKALQKDYPTEWREKLLKS
ncbi:VirB4 family type IV secretion/conjugal transfer ATPase [Helicobacter pylori]|uniref:VirB4 family type IV secretion/conjugal transfer ATPase n=1 Tax=Helicobacter pylori TaxID=210 RepID=UPI00038C7D57|nr:VirB4 family type IV secretion/conjugal transfer ATPase [Helicobacter pylori]EQD98778.1 transporter [Helicobacter pylori PZ5004]QTP04262.1 VirB4 family type IV secretion/conjugal transfer ATPase [Helicobacter pylori]WQU36336.1 VirB4 family type IV secretion/conjugal transfer ATPase [Helicobacter pylori]WQU37785.1 VirB4 family type IV secretion/conjugal transfer ATPase [Helicobacter pylori]